MDEKLIKDVIKKMFSSGEIVINVDIEEESYLSSSEREVIVTILDENNNMLQSYKSYLALN